MSDLHWISLLYARAVYVKYICTESTLNATMQFPHTVHPKVHRPYAETAAISELAFAVPLRLGLHLDFGFFCPCLSLPLMVFKA